VVFYDKPILKFARLLETYLAVAPGGWRTFPTVLSNWLGEKLDLRKAIRAELPELRPDCANSFHRTSSIARRQRVLSVAV
jgi:carbamoyltransferase